MCTARELPRGEVTALPANLSPLYLAAEARFRQAITDEERLAALEDMLANIPKHKGTEKMQADIKRRIARIRENLRSGSKGGSRRRDIFRIDKEGAGQIALVGPANVGKSMIVKAMTRAQPEVTDYPFATRTPLPGMSQWENVQIQLIDMPAMAPEMAQPWVWAALRLADGFLIVMDLGNDDLLTHYEDLMAYLNANNIKVKNRGERSFTEKKAIIAANKCDMPGAQDRLDLLREIVGDDIDIVPCSALTGEGLGHLNSRMFFDVLNKIRVYTHPPGKKPDFRQPFILDRDTTVIEAARDVHKDIADNLKYARVWGTGVFDGQMVPRDHVLHDGDIVVFYTKD